VNSGVRHHFITGFKSGDQSLLFLLPFLLRAEQHEIHDDENENERDEKSETASWAWRGRGGLRLS
jgi:hypothetical protein